MTRNMEHLLHRHRKEAEDDVDLVIESRRVNELKRCTKTVQSCLPSDDDTEDAEEKSGGDQLLLSMADIKVRCLFIMHCKKNIKLCFCIAQYPVRWTAQSALNFTPSRLGPTQLLSEAFYTRSNCA